jgi:4a-hydroxytetrahydrobiopterin dehydratase
VPAGGERRPGAAGRVGSAGPSVAGRVGTALSGYSERVTLLSGQQLESALADSRWQRDGDGDGASIVREWELADFAAAIAFVNRVAEAAEQANHHPDIHVHGWNKVRLELSTHSEGGVTQADLDMARRIDALT